MGKSEQRSGWAWKAIYREDAKDAKEEKIKHLPRKDTEFHGRKKSNQRCLASGCFLAFFASSR